MRPNTVELCKFAGLVLFPVTFVYYTSQEGFITDSRRHSAEYSATNPVLDKIIDRRSLEKHLANVKARANHTSAVHDCSDKQ